MRVLGVIVLVAVVVAASAPLAAAQRAPDLPPSLFEPAPDRVVPGAPGEDGGKAPFVLAAALLAAAAAAGYAAGSASRTRRS